MAHTPEIIDNRQLSNGQVAILCRCCADAMTDYWHTMAPTLTDQELDADILAVKAKVSAAHDAMQTMVTRLRQKTGLAVTSPSVAYLIK